MDTNDIKVIEKDSTFKISAIMIFVIVSAIASLPLIQFGYGVLIIQIISFTIVIWFLIQIIHFLLARNYIPVSATIKEYYIVKHQRFDGESSMSLDNISLDYEACLSFSYEYKGKQYISKKLSIDSYQNYFREKISLFKDYNAKKDCINYLVKFVEHNDIYAYVNPLYPKEAVLDRVINKEALWMKIAYIFLALFIGIGIGYL